MTDSGIQKYSIVRNNRPSASKPQIGRILELDGDNARVEFWDGSKLSVPQSFLESLPDDAAEARLWKQPESLESWVKEAPLKLVAVALSISGNSGKVADIREKLDGQVLSEGQWNSWWKKRTKSISNLQTHFETVKTGKGNEYKLLSSVAGIPPDWKPPPKPKAVKPADWKRWLESRTQEPTPGRFPTRQVANSYTKWSARWSNETVNNALFRVLTESDRLISSADGSAQAAEGWLRTLSQAALSWRDTGQPDPTGLTASRVGAVLARLAKIAGDRTPEDLLLRAGALDGKSDAWRGGFVAGMWESFVGEDAREMYLSSTAVVGRQAREVLARELFLAAFDPNFSQRRYTELDRLLDALSEEQRAQLLHEVIALAKADQRNNVLSYVANSRHAKGPDAQDFRLLASLVLGDGTDEFVAGVSAEFADVLDQSQKYSKAVQAVLTDATKKANQDKSRAHAKMQEQQQDLEHQIQKERQELGRLEERVESLRNQLFSGYEQSKLDIRQDMLIIVGELSQLAAVEDYSSENFVRDMRAGLALALRAGDGKPLGAVGDYASFDPLRHHGDDSLRIGDSVKITAPGVIVKGQRTDDRVLVKARVSKISEKC